jgi:RNA polymerase sigma-70 factor, ECF subfamily
MSKTDIYVDQNDEQIATMVQNGDKEAYGVLIDRYDAKLKRYATRFLREKEDITDIVQDVFIKAYINLQSFDTKLKFNSWIYRIAHNEFVNKIAWKSIRKFVPIDADELIPLAISAPENVMRDAIQENEKKIMETYLSKLDDKYKTPIILFYYDDMSYEEISDILQIPGNTVGVRIKRGKDKLKNIIEEEKTKWQK